MTLGLAPIATWNAGRVSIAARHFSSAWQGGALDREFEAALDDRGERNLGEGELAEREPLALGELAVENFELLVERLHLLGEVRGTRIGCVLGVLEHRHVGRIERAEIPVHPALDHGLFGGSRAVQGGRMQRREIAHDRVGLPDNQVAVDHGRHLGVGVERTVGVGLGIPELPAVVFARVRNVQLFQQEEHLLDVSRRLPSEQLDHVMSSCSDVRCGFVRKGSRRSGERSDRQPLRGL